MFNLLPGQGLGMSASQDLAFGLWSMQATPVTPPVEVPTKKRRVGGGYWVDPVTPKRPEIIVFDSVYAKKDDEIVEILAILFGVIE